jgi:hypothetical protein
MGIAVSIVVMRAHIRPALKGVKQGLDPSS